MTADDIKQALSKLEQSNYVDIRPYVADFVHRIMDSGATTITIIRSKVDDTWVIVAKDISGGYNPPLASSALYPPKVGAKLLDIFIESQKPSE